MPPSLFEKAEEEQSVLKAKLTLMDSQLSTNVVTPLSEHEVTRYLKMADTTQKDIEENFKTINLSAPKGTDKDPHIQEYTRMTVMAIRLLSGFHGLKAAFPVASTSTSTTSAAAPAPTVSRTIKLPALELPKFSGNLQEWVSFRDIFLTAVHKSSLSKVEKLTQLKSLLTGEAARQVRSLVLSDTNYDIAWKSLQERYENNRELLFSLLRRLISQQPIQSATATSVRSLIDTTKECIRSLEVLSMPTQHWDAIILYLLFTKIDPSSRELWEQSLPDTSIPDLSKMFEFLEQRARALAAGNQQQPRSQNQRNNPDRKVHAHHVTPGAEAKCKIGCSVFHPIYKCPVFNQNTPQQRLELLKRNNLCYNCFHDKHGAQSCQSRFSCKTCSKRHHTMIHAALTTDKGPEVPPPPILNGHTQTSQPVQAALLATAAVRVISTVGVDYQCRAFLDNGSSVSFITESAARRLKLKLHPNSTPVTGLSAAPVGIATHTTSIVIKPHFESDITYNVNVLVINRISTDLPTMKCDPTDWPHIRELTLADPRFGDPAPVDLLLGSDVFWNILGNEKITGSKGQPLAIKSSLGWLIAGKHTLNPPVNAFITNAQLDASLQRFWDQEELQQEEVRSNEEEECIKHFATTHFRNNQGRFVTSIPWKTPRPQLGDSKRHAIQRLLSLENRLVHQKGIRDLEKLKQLGSYWESYKKFMLEYESLGHMTLIQPNDNKPSYYIPHHFVVKESSTTTKLRVVFDASAPTSNGVNLNSCMMVGPQLQDSLINIMLRFRTHPIAFSADLEKMYRQILIREEDRCYQRILWRDDPSKPIQEFELNTVTYGTASAPYLAVCTLQQLAKDEQQSFPVASAKALEDFYVDDLLSGEETTKDAKLAVNELINMTEKGGFQLRKWTSNSEELLLSIPEELRETNPIIPLQLESSPSVKTLGVFWNPIQDEYHFKLELPISISNQLTKRIALSEISKIFDPCGWLAPALITFKIFMQELWKTNLSWDDKLPDDLYTKWESLRSSLQHIESIRIPRCVIHSKPERVTLCGFSDASMKAYAAVVYVCCTYNNHPPSCHLLTSKTRVAPVHAVTLPRLELNGAVLLSELLKTTLTALKRPVSDIRAFTDSTITLCWIQGDPSRWKTYVKNRVQTIRNNVPKATWYHIPGERNPADCASRGIPTSDLKHHPLWWNAITTSEMLDDNIQYHPLPQEDDIIAVKSEEKPISCHITIPTIPDTFNNFSSFYRFQRVVAWMYRFVENCRKQQRKQERNTQPLSTDELAVAHHSIIRTIQYYYFNDEIKALQQSKELSSKSTLLSLHPFLADDGLLRVGGRIRNANIPHHQKFPILLPRAHPIITSIIRDIHRRYLHTGPSSTIGILNQKYWIIRVRDAVRAVIRKCVTCTRHSATTMKQFMGNLPFDRVNPSRPFSKVGIDYAGPFSTRSPGRSKIVFKCWLSIFVCFSTRAIHIEVVSELTTNAFIAALRRFISRRGPPSDIYSDCGTNFKGADKVLRQFTELTRDPAVSNELTSHQVTWHFNPVGAPHFGGLWEAGVRSIKHHLVRVIGQSLLTYEEMLTLVCQIEAILNSRPLTPASSDPSDFEALTPAHFLIGGRMMELPQPSLTNIKENHLDRWQLVQQRQQHFWKRWSSEFLTRLQQRPKWARVQDELQVGNMVLVKDERLPPLKWKLGRVAAVHPGSDGHVRVATIKTVDGDIKRPIVKLSLLPITE